MQIRLMPRLEKSGCQMRIRVPTEQQHLKDEHAGRPDCRTAAKPGENEFPDQGLNLEQQECAEKDGRSICRRESASEVAWIHSEPSISTVSRQGVRDATCHDAYSHGTVCTPSGRPGI